MANYYFQMFFDGDGQGTSEGYFLNAQGLTQAKTDAALLVTGRLAMIYLGYTLVYARVSDLQVLRDAYPIGNGARAGAMTSGKVNRVADCMLARGQHPSPPGGHNNFFWHFVPDDSIVDGSYFPTGNAAYDTALAAWLVTVKSLCGWAPTKKKQSQKVLITAYDSVTIRDITSRKVGRPFGQQVGRRVRR